MITDYKFWQKAMTLYPRHRSRIERGRSLLQQHLNHPLAGIIKGIPTPTGLMFAVQSRSKRNLYYTVTTDGCTCPDWSHSHRCKHYIAATVLARMAGAELAQSQLALPLIGDTAEVGLQHAM